MFQALIQKAQGAVNTAIGKVLTRAAVAVPLVMAAGFGIAALTVALSQAFGPALSYTIMAGVFVAIAGVTAMVMSRTETEPQPVQDEAPSLAENVAEFATPLLDRDTILPLLTTAGPMALPALLRLAARNLPLLVVAVIVAMFFFGRSLRADEQTTGTSDEPVPSPHSQGSGSSCRSAPLCREDDKH
jgi:hypothetical protein